MGSEPPILRALEPSTADPPLPAHTPRNSEAPDCFATLAADITNWVEHWNDNPTPFVWTKTADEILDKLARYCSAVTGTEYDDGTA